MSGHLPDLGLPTILQRGEGLPQLRPGLSDVDTREAGKCNLARLVACGQSQLCQLRPGGVRRTFEWTEMMFLEVDQLQKSPVDRNVPADKAGEQRRGKEIGLQEIEDRQPMALCERGDGLRHDPAGSRRRRRTVTQERLRRLSI